MGSLEYLSPSTLEEYLKCSLRTWARKIKKVPKISRPEIYGRGSQMHDLYQWLNECLFDGKPTIPKPELADIPNAQKLEDMLTQEAYNKPFVNAGKMLTEEELRIYIDGCYIPLLIKPDLVLIEGGDCYIYDLKTGKITKERKCRNIQALAYIYGMLKQTETPIQTVSFYWEFLDCKEETLKLEEFIYNDDDLQFFENTFKTVVRSVSLDVWFPNPSGCYLCDFREQCRYSNPKEW